jgi:DNA repair exonuclease SbcCD nuclease subunit
MRLLVFSDLHLDAPFAWAGAELARSRRRALRECLTRIVELATRLRVDALCCAGDLYEQQRFTPDTVAFLQEMFARLQPIPVLLAPGNHDWLGPPSLYRQARWSSNVQLFEDPSLQPYELAPGFTVWGAAHCAPANTPGFFESGFRVDRSGVHIGLFHGSERGDIAHQGESKVPHAPFRAADIPAAGLRHALVGHFHTPRDAQHHTYPGNPEPLTFGETGERGAVLVTVDEAGELRRERHRVAVADVGDITVDLTGVAHSGEVRDRVASRLVDHKGIVRVTLVGEVAPEVDVELADLADVAPHLDALVPRIGALTVGYDYDALAAEQTVRGQFVRDVRAADLDEEQRRRVLVTGLRALDGRGDLAVRSC